MRMPTRAALLAIWSILAGTMSFAADQPPAVDAAELAQQKLLVEGINLAKMRKPQEAISGYFDKVLAYYESKYADPKMKYYAARSPTESLLYLAEAANNHEAARVVSFAWAEAYYMKAYALEDLGRLAEAKASLTRALALSPHNSGFMAELANIYQIEKKWPDAEAEFRLAEDAAQLSPPQSKNVDLARAWRGIAYVWVEEGKLDDAAALYRKCLDLDPNDTRARAALAYVEKKKSGDAAAPTNSR
jgi:tetratricopeptide (TPR) repeat protein